MKTWKIFSLSIIQSVLYILLWHFAIRVFFPFQDFLPDDAAAIGIIGGADGPTAIYVASKLLTGGNNILSFVVVFLIASITNLSALITNKLISLIILICCIILLLIFTLFAFHNLAGSVSMCLLSAILLLSGYLFVKKYRKQLYGSSIPI